MSIEERESRRNWLIKVRVRMAELEIKHDATLARIVGVSKATISDMFNYYKFSNSLKKRINVALDIKE